jgi:hypothetical protein
MKNKNLIALLAVASLVAVSWVWTTTTNPKADCVTVYVDYGVLKNQTTDTQCIAVDGPIRGMDALNAAGLAILGTEKYGLDIVCRVNSLPSGASAIGIKGHENYIETCKDMPAEFAYWAILVRDGSNPWGWSQTGLSEIKLDAGDSIGLVFSDNENVEFPND